MKASQSPQNRFVCQEYAKLYVALTRAIGIESWLVHIDRDAFGYPCYHDCAAILVDGHVMLVDPTWRLMGILHKEYSVLDDVQAISHHLMQSLTDKPDPRRLRVGLKLNPDDHWTRVQFVMQMAAAGEMGVAQEEMKKLEREPEKWDVHLASAELHEANGRWSETVGALARALALSPSNAVVHMKIARAYDRVGNSSEAEKHLADALELDRGGISSEMRESASLRLALGNARSDGRPGRAVSQQTLVLRAEAGDTVAQIALGQMAFDKGNIQEALDWLRKAADQGSALAQLNYARGLVAALGKEGGNDALMWFTRAAEQGAADAQHDLGLMLYEGKLVPEDMVAAYTWMSLAAAQEHKKAKSMLRYMELFISPDELARARKRTAEFTPVKKPTPKN